MTREGDVERDVGKVGQPSHGGTADLRILPVRPNNATTWVKASPTGTYTGDRLIRVIRQFG